MTPSLIEMLGKNIVSHDSVDIDQMRFTHMLIKHLDLLYNKMLAKDMSQPVLEIAGSPYMQTREWFNPGQGIKQSAVVQ